MSVLLTAVAVLLILLSSDTTIKGVGVALLLSVQAMWIVAPGKGQADHSP
jgi:hypothetical protein